MKKLNSQIYQADEIKDFRELLNRSAEKYPNNVAYKFKENLGKPNQKICEKYKVNFNEITNIIEKLKSLQEKQDTNEMEKYIQKLDNNALKFFEQKNKEESEAR